MWVQEGEATTGACVSGWAHSRQYVKNTVPIAPGSLKPHSPNFLLAPQVPLFLLPPWVQMQLQVSCGKSPNFCRLTPNLFRKAMCWPSSLRSLTNVTMLMLKPSFTDHVFTEEVHMILIFLLHDPYKASLPNYLMQIWMVGCTQIPFIFPVPVLCLVTVTNRVPSPILLPFPS